jgi:hypothetical protein
MRPLSRGGPGQGAEGRWRPEWCDSLEGDFAQPSGSASEPSVNLAPRLDRSGSSLPWARRHFIISLHRDKGRGVSVVRVAVCSRTVSSGSRRCIRRAGIAVLHVVRRRGVGVGRRLAGVIGPARRDASGGGHSSSAIGSGVENGPRRRPRSRRRRARASAQPVRTKILSSACALGPAVTSRSG